MYNEIIKWRRANVSPIYKQYDCISLTVKSNVNVDISPPSREVSNGDLLKECKTIFKFDKTRKHVYEQALRGDMNVEGLRSILAQANNGEDVDRGISKMNNILINAAKKASFTKRSANEKKVTKQHTHEWYNRECKARQRILRQCSKKVILKPL